jgi:hypothetical protein
MTKADQKPCYTRHEEWLSARAKSESVKLKK